MSTTFQRISDNHAGTASRIVAADRGAFTLTALRNGSGNLELINWSTGGAAVKRVNDSGNQAGSIGEVAVTTVRNLAITAVRNGSNALELISWDDNAGQGPIVRRADSGHQAGEASLIAVKALASATGVVTALRNGSGNLMLITWAVDINGNFKRLADAHAGEVSGVALSVLGNIAVTAVRNGSGNLELITWAISPDGTRITRRTDSGNQAGSVSGIAMAEAGATRVVTAVRNGSDNLELISWDIAADGTTIRRLADIEAGTVNWIDLARFGANRFVTAVKAGNDHLKLIAYDLAATGAFTRTGDSGDAAGDIDEVSLVMPPSNNLVTAVRNGSGDLELIAWRMLESARVHVPVGRGLGDVRKTG